MPRSVSVRLVLEVLRGKPVLAERGQDVVQVLDGHVRVHEDTDARVDVLGWVEVRHAARRPFRVVC